MLSYLNTLADELEPDMNRSTSFKTTGLSCGETFAVCASGAYAFQIAGLTTCNAGWVFPPVAALCYAGVMVSTYFILEGCGDSYNSCRLHESTPKSALAKAVSSTFYIQ